MNSHLSDIETDCLILTNRIVNAPIEMVFEAWTNPAHLQQWWGPAGFTNTFIRFDVEPGGTWEFIMHGPDKGNYKNECVFTRVEKPVMLAWKRISKPIFNVLVLFAAMDDRYTEIRYHMIFDTKEECNHIKKLALAKNEENFDRLEAQLEVMKFKNNLEYES